MDSTSTSLIIRKNSWGTWVSQSVKHPTLGLGAGHDLTVRGFEPLIRLCVDSVEPAQISLSLSMSKLKKVFLLQLKYFFKFIY